MIKFLFLSSILSFFFANPGWSAENLFSSNQRPSVLKAAEQIILDSASQSLISKIKLENIKLHFSSQFKTDHIGQVKNGIIHLNEKILLESHYLNQIKSKSQFKDHSHFVASALLHEIAHLLDIKRLSQREEGLQFSSCEILTGTAINEKHSSWCKSLAKKRGLYSYANSFISASGRRVGNNFDLINLNHKTSQDPYEFESLRESFAVNFEYFVLDPNFACRRPAINQVLESFFGKQKKARSGDCDEEIGFIFMGENGNLKSIKVNQIQKVSYFFASEGESLGSNFGHAMLYFTACPSAADVNSKSCDNEIQEHFVLSPAALIYNSRISTLDGLSGKYELNYFVIPASKVIYGYNEIELRSIEQFPVQLSPAEISRVALEFAWTMNSSYYFLSNNCAHGVFSILNSAHDLEGLAESGFNPLELKRLLQEKHLINEDPTRVFRPSSFRVKLKAKLENELGIKWNHIVVLDSETLSRKFDALEKNKIFGAPSLAQLIYLILNEKKSNIEARMAVFVKEKEHLSSAKIKEEIKRNLVVTSGLFIEDYGVAPLSEAKEKVRQSLQLRYDKQNKNYEEFKMKNLSLIHDYEGLSAFYYSLLKKSVNGE